MNTSRDSSVRKIAIIPVYHDKGKLAQVLVKFPDNVVDEICLVVDCPTKSELKEIAAIKCKMATSVHVIINSIRKGVGSAIREGIDHALAEQYEVAVVLAGNNKDDPREIPCLLKAIEDEGCDYVQGSRFIPGGKRVKNPFQFHLSLLMDHVHECTMY
jgi:dolichol-phosphate mannosyltransferase